MYLLRARYTARASVYRDEFNSVGVTFCVNDQFNVRHTSRLSAPGMGTEGAMRRDCQSRHNLDWRSRGGNSEEVKSKLRLKAMAGIRTHRRGRRRRPVAGNHVHSHQCKTEFGGGDSSTEPHVTYSQPSSVSYHSCDGHSPDS